MADQSINIKLLIDAAESAKTVAETRKALKDLRSAALQVEEGSQAFTSITTAAGQLQDKIGDLASTTKFLGDDLKNLKGFTSVASGIAGAFAAAQGAAALFGGENKQLEASLLKVQSAMSILQGVQAVGEVLQKESAASLLVQNGLRKTAIALAGEEAVAKAAVAVANGTATITQRALNAAMTANPVIALVAVLVTATAALMAFSSSSNEASESQKALNDDISKSKLSLEVELKTFNSQIEALKKLKTGSEERAIAIKKINDQYGTTLKNLNDENEFLKQVNIAQQDYIAGAKNRILSKINESKAEAYLLLAQQQRESGGRIQRIKDEIADIKRKKYFNEEFRKADLAHWKQQLDDENATNDAIARGYEARAEKVLGINADLNTKETAQQKAAREKEAEALKADALKTEQDRNNKNKERQKSEEDHLKKMADLNREYEKALAELVVETNDNLLEQEELLLSISGESEANAIAKERLDTEVKTTEELKNQQSELQKLTDIKVKEAEAKTGKTATEEQVSNIKKSIQESVEYQTYLKSSNAIIEGLTKKGEDSIYSIQKDYVEKRKKLLEETTKRVLSTGEYERFIKLLNKANELYDQQQVEDSERQLAAQEKLLKSKERNVEYQKQINKELVDSGLATQEEVDKTISDIQDKNKETLRIISELKKEIESFKDAPVAIPQDSVADLEKYYQKYKGQTEKLFDLGRQSNLDQLGNNQKSIEILSALYGEKYHIIKDGEDKINKELEGTGVKFGINPKEGEVGLKALIDLMAAENKVLSQAQKDKIITLLEGNKEIKGLNQELLDSYKKLSEEEQKYFEKATFENYTNQQKKLSDNKVAYASGEINKRQFEEKNLEIEKEFNDIEKNIKQNHEENLLAIGVVYGEKTQADIVDFGKDRKSEKQRQADEEIAIEQKKNDYLIQSGQTLLNTLKSFSDDMMQNTLNRIEQERELRLAAIDAELVDFDNRDKEITAAEQAKIDERKAIEDRKALVQAEYDKKLRDEKIRQFNINKAMDVVQIGINTAVAVSRSLIPPATVMIPFIVAAGAAEALFVASQQPNFADGGLVVGPGGPKDDMINANLSNGEVVINANSSKKYAQVLDAINRAGGGKPIPFRNGGVVTNPMPTSTNSNMEDFKDLILDIVSRPIETYVKESSITNAQKSQSQQNRRTSF